MISAPSSQERLMNLSVFKLVCMSNRSLKRADLVNEVSLFLPGFLTLQWTCGEKTFLKFVFTVIEI